MAGRQQPVLQIIKQRKLSCDGLASRHKSMSEELLQGKSRREDEKGIDKCGWITSKIGDGCQLTTYTTQDITQWGRMVAETSVRVLQRPSWSKLTKFDKGGKLSYSSIQCRSIPSVLDNISITQTIFPNVWEIIAENMKCLDETRSYENSTSATYLSMPTPVRCSC